MEDPHKAFHVSMSCMDIISGDKMSQTLGELIEERDNDAIINYLEKQSSSSKEDFKVIIP